jgi:hypothetical protein
VVTTLPTGSSAESMIAAGSPTPRPIAACAAGSPVAPAASAVPTIAPVW